MRSPSCLVGRLVLLYQAARFLVPGLYPAVPKRVSGLGAVWAESWSRAHAQDRVACLEHSINNGLAGPHQPAWAIDSP